MLGIDDATQWLALSPISHAAELPPTILFAGDGDALTPACFTLDLYTEMRAAQRVADLHLLADLPHEFVSLPGMMDLSIANAVAFFTRTVIEARAFETAQGDLSDWWATVLPNLGTKG